MAKQGPFDNAIPTPRQRGGSSLPAGQGQRTAVNPADPADAPWGPHGSETQQAAAPNGWGVAPGEGVRLGSGDPNAVGQYWGGNTGPKRNGK